MREVVGGRSIENVPSLERSEIVSLMVGCWVVVIEFCSDCSFLVQLVETLFNDYMSRLVAVTALPSEIAYR